MVSFTRSEIAAFYAASVPALRQTRSKEWRGPCPVHKGEDDNFAVEAETGRAFCFSTCNKGWDVIGLQQTLTRQTFKMAAAEVNRIVGRPEPKNGKPPVYRKVAEHLYTDKGGRTVFMIERRLLANGEKDFKARMPGPSGRWIWKKSPIADSLPYRLHKFASAETVYTRYGTRVHS
jgi:hypothetical protein